MGETVRADHILDDLDDAGYLTGLIARAGKSGDNTAFATQVRVAAEIYVGQCLRRSISEPREALAESAAAANRHAQGLRCATWALVGATLVLAAAALLQAFLP